jgi:glycerate kinase
MHILISPNAFKHSLDAAAAARAIAEGLQQSELSCTTQCFPVGDGGDGTGALLTQLCQGTSMTMPTFDPLGREINASFGLIDNGNTAVIEMAAASGLHLLKQDELSPLHASSFGTGIQIRQALGMRVNTIILCVGGSATVDGGSGILRALGFRFLDNTGKELMDLPAELLQLATIDAAAVDSRVTGCSFVILCDVKNILLGENGAAAVFGPQKGASEKQVQELETCLLQYTEVVKQITHTDMSVLLHGGAAGGTAAGLHALLDAELKNGIDHFLDITRFDAALDKAALVITGEGSLDLQTLEGKAPYGVAIRARQKNIPVIAMTGRVAKEHTEALRKYFDQVLAINPPGQGLEVSLAAAFQNLVNTSKILGNDIASRQ